MLLWLNGAPRENSRFSFSRPVAVRQTDDDVAVALTRASRRLQPVHDPRIKLDVDVAILGALPSIPTLPGRVAAMAV